MSPVPLQEPRKRAAVKGLTYATDLGENGCLSLLTRAQDRALRAAAWRHCRRINARVARSVWVAVRKRQRAQLWEVAA